MPLSVDWARPLDSRTRRHGVDYATRSAEFALMRGEASIALRIARQLVLAQPRIREHQVLLDRALAARDAASDTIARGAGAADPDAIDAVAVAHLALGEHRAAADLWLGLARADSTRIDAFLSFAWCMARAGDTETAGRIAERLAPLAEHPKLEALQMMVALADNDRPKALAHARRALALDARAAAWLPMGPVFERAAAATDAALSLGFRLEDISATLHLYEVARAIQDGRHREAVEGADQVLAAIPDDRWAAMFKVIALASAGLKAEAVLAQAALAAMEGAQVGSLARLVDLLYELEAHQQIVDLGKILLARLPGRHALIFSVAHSASYLADMDTVEEVLALLPASPAEVQTSALSPFAMLTLFDDPALQKQTAIRRAESLPGPMEACPVRLPAAPSGGRIRIGYLSNDYHNHATMKLLTAVLERTDRTRFETFAYSYDRLPEDPDRQRAAAAVDRFVDVAALSDEQLAEQARRDGIHVMVDLKGYTGGARLSPLRHRLAPIQVNWLGYPGTYGLPEVDYIIADRSIIPPGAEGHYCERVVRLPDCYQPNGRDRPLKAAPTRREAGLPDAGFVFASFNQVYKINARLFAAWMEILAGVPGSVLWLFAKGDGVTDRLRRRAESHGIAGERLIFAPPLGQADHLARYGLVDLALDTYPVGSHTTASDALWMGAPLLALAGRSFVSRVSGSIVEAAGLPQLVAGTFEEYTAKAIALGNDPGTARALREMLLRTRETMPLFDADRFAAHLGAAYETMVDIWRRGEAPRSFDVAPLAGAAAAERALAG